MLSVAVIGTGNVARQLCSAWQKSPTVQVVQVVGRSQLKEMRFEGHLVASFEELTSDVNCYIIAVSDSSIAPVFQHFKKSDALFIHTSGSVPVDVLNGQERIGVLYPLQTMSSGREVNLTQVPIFLETKQEADREILQQLADSLSEHTYWVNSDKRRQLHLAAVFLNNFTNHLLYLSGERCKEMGMDPEILYPLLEETVSKAIAIGPYRAQTGPARRGDSAVIEEHIDMIDDPTQQEIYRFISQSIQTTYENELQKLT